MAQDPNSQIVLGPPPIGNEALAPASIALFLDVDGTLLEIA